MKVPCVKATALAAVSLALMGCASTSSLVRVGLLGAARGKDPVAMQNSLVAAGSLLDPEEALHQAQALRKSADFQGAAKLLSQLAQASPDDARVLGEYAKTLIALNRPSDGLTYVDRAIALEPDDWTLHSARGVALDQRKDYAAAQLSYDRALTLKPGEPIILSNAALSHMHAGDLAGAEALLLQATQAGSEFPRIATNLAMVRSMRATSQPAPTPQATVIVSAPPAKPPAVAATVPKPQAPVVASVPPVEHAAPVATAVPKPVQKPAVPAVTNSPVAREAASAAQTNAAIIQASPSVETPKSDSAVLRPTVSKDAKGEFGAPKKAAKKEIPTALLLRPALTEGRPIALASAQGK